MARASSRKKFIILVLIAGAQLLITSCDIGPMCLYAQFIDEGEYTRSLQIAPSGTDLKLFMKALNSPLSQDPFKVLLQIKVRCENRGAEVGFNPGAIHLILGNERMGTAVITTVVRDHRLTEYGSQLPSLRGLPIDRYPDIYEIRNVYEIRFSEEDKINPETIDNSLSIILKDFITYNGLPVPFDTVQAVIPISKSGEATFIDETMPIF